MKHVHYSHLTGSEREIAKLAAIALNDTYDGRARALVLADNEIDGYDPHEVVSDIYSRSTGQPSRQWEAWECPECGQAHLGIEAAFECCRESDD